MNPESREVWVIDTSSVLEVRRKVPREQQVTVFERMAGLVNHDQLFYPRQVVDELERYANPKLERDLPLEWGKRNLGRASSRGPSLESVKAVLAEVPEVLDPDKAGVEEADPYLIALARELVEAGFTVTVLSEERKDRPDKMSIATACGLLKIPCVPMMAFLRRKKIWT